MGLENYSRHQQGIIKRYYRNLDSIQSQRLAELVTELYLSEGKALDRRWKQVTDLLTKMEVPATRIEHLLSRRDPALLAEFLKELDSTGS